MVAMSFIVHGACQSFSINKIGKALVVSVASIDKVSRGRIRALLHFFTEASALKNK